MKGLEISEVALKDVLLDNATFRIDPEYFKKEYTHFSPCDLNVKPLSYFVASGYRVVYGNTEVLNPKFAKPGDSPFFLQAVDIQTPFINSDNLKYVCKGDWDRYPQGRIKRGELLIEVKGQLEKVAVVPEDFPEHTLVSGTLYKMTINDKISKYVILAYLISKFGVSFKNRYKTNLLVSYISKDDLYRIPVPEFSKRLQDKVDAIFCEIFANQEAAKVAYNDAEQMLLAELGFAGWSPTDDAVSIKSYSDFVSAGRFDAEYFQPKFDELFTMLSKCRVRPLGGNDGLVNIQRSIEPGSDAYSDKGVPFVRIADFTEMGITPPEIHVPPEVCTDSPRPKKDTILLSKDGSVGIAYKVEEDLGVVTSSGILHLTVKDDAVLPDYLTLVLNSKIVRLQAERDAGGSIIQHWKQSEIERVKIPLLPLPRQRAIATKVQSSFALRAESKRLLGIAKRMVEMAVEQGETVALEWLGRMKV